MIDAADVQLVAANFGFRATQPPVVQAGAVMTHAGLPVQFNLAPLATDPQGEPVFFTVVGAVNGTATLNPDGTTVTFIPAPGFTGIAQFQYEADDGQEVSTPAIITVTVSGAPLLSLDFQTREPRLLLGGGTQIVALGNFADQQGVTLDPSYVSFQSTNPAVATVTSLGELAGLTDGTSILIVSAQGLQAETAVTVGPVTSLSPLDQTLYNEGINTYPLAVALSALGGTRQFDVHPVGDINLTTDLSTAGSGTRYFASPAGIVTITPDGLMSAVSPGQATVTIINGPAETVIPVLVQTPQTGTVTVGAGGGVVEGSNGSIVAVPPGDLATATPVSITPATEASLPQILPDGITFAAAFNLNIGETGVSVPVQLAIPVAPGTPVGTTVYFYRAGQFLNADGTTQPIWWQVESGVVESNGMAYTHSPPEQGVDNSGLYLVGFGSEELADFNLELNKAQIQGALAGQLDISIAIDGANGSLTGAMASVDESDIDATLAVPAEPEPTPVLVSILEATSLPAITTYPIQLEPGQAFNFTTTLTVPPPAPTDPPVISKVSLIGSSQAPEIEIDGSGFLTAPDNQPVVAANVLVSFTQGNVAPIKVSPISVADGKVIVAVPDGAVLGISQIAVLRPDLAASADPSQPNGSKPSTIVVASNPAQFDPSGSYIFATLPEGDNDAGSLAVITNNSGISSVVENVPLGTPDLPTSPRNVAVTPDDSRAYVTLEGTGQIAVVDTLTLNKVDVHPQSAAAPATTPPTLPTTGVVLDPSLNLTEITSPTVIYGTANLPGQMSWELELGQWTGTWKPVEGVPALAQGDGTVSNMPLLSLDPSTLLKDDDLPSGFYVLGLVAMNALGEPTQPQAESLVGLGGYSDVINLPLGAMPFGITIDPSGNYAYVSDARPYAVPANYVAPEGNVAPPAGSPMSQVYVIDINPDSPTYNEVVETIQIVVSGLLPDGSLPSVVGGVNGLIAPNGLQDITITPDGKQLEVTAPNFSPDPNGGPFDELPGNLIQIDLTPNANFTPPTVNSIIAIPGGQGTYGVAVAPTPTSATAGQPTTYQVAFTNPESDANGVEVLNLAADTKTVIPFDLDPADDSNNPLYNYVQDNDLAEETYLEAHNAGGIVFYTDPSSGTLYAFVAGRADQGTSVVGGGFDGVDLSASAVSGYLDQLANPLFEDGNVAIIENPLGNPEGDPSQRPVVVGATRPVPYGYPVDLALTPPDPTTNQQYLYVSYQGLPTTNGLGGIFVFNATAMIKLVDTLSESPNGMFDLVTNAVDNIIVLPNGNYAAGLNISIDVNAAYEQYAAPVLDSSGNPVLDSDGNPVTQEVFGVPPDDSGNAPLITGGFPGGIAIETGPAPQITVLQPTPVASGSGGNNGGGSSIELVANNVIQITTTVDAINKTVSTSGGTFDFSLNIPAVVTLSIQDATTDEDVDVENIPNPIGGAEDFQNGISLTQGTYETSLAALGTQETPGTYDFSLTATAADGKSTTVTGTIILTLQENSSLPVGHTIIDGVDIWDGHLTVSSDDVTIPGQGLDLNFTRTYSSAGSSIAGPLGAGWTDSYNVQLVRNSSGIYTIIGGDGSGNAFSPQGATNPALAQLFGLPSSAVFYNPQVGYHSTLVQPNPSQDPNEFYFYTTDHTLYDFQLQPELTTYDLQAVQQLVYTLRYTEDSDGNRIDLYYSDDLTDSRLSLTNPAAAGFLPAALQAYLDNGPPLSLSVVKDSSDRALLLNYQYIFNANRIVQINGFDLDSSDGGNLLGLELDYGYDQWGNLTSVVRRDSATGAVLKKETYTYSPGPGVTGHNLLTYTEPNGFDAQGNPIANEDFTTTYSYLGLDPNGNPLPGPDFNAAGAYTGIYSLQTPGQNSFFGVPDFEIVNQVSQPGGSSPDSLAITKFTYNFSTGPNTPNTRVVTDPRQDQGVPSTTYTLDSYGATIEISAPDGSGQFGSNNTYMTWADPNSPQKNAFSNVDGPLTPNEASGIDVEMVSMTDPEGRTTSYVYDVNGNAIQKTISFVGMSSAYLAVTEPDGTTPISPDSVTTSYTYDPIFNLMTSETDADLNTTFYIYDSNYESTHPLPNLPTTLAGGASLPPFTGLNTGDLLATIDPIGATTLYTYATSASVGSSGSVYGYNGTYGLGDLMTATVVRGGLLNEVTQYVQYDPYGNATVIVDPAGNYTTRSFDVRSRLIVQTTYGGQDAAKNSTVYVYDGLDRVVRQTEIDELAATKDSTNLFSLPQDSQFPLPAPFAGQMWAQETISQYLPGGQVTETINGLGQITLYQYDNGDRLISETEKQVEQAGGAGSAVGSKVDLVTAYVYDADDNLVQETDARGIVTLYEHNDLNQVYSTIVLPLFAAAGPLATNQPEVTYSTYDVLGNKLSDTDVHGNVTKYEYDGLYRLKVTILPVPGTGGQPAEILMGYDPVGNKVRQTDANGDLDVTTYAYDKANRLSTQTDPMGAKVEYAYDPSGNMILEIHESPTEQTPTGPVAGSPLVVTYVVAYAYDQLNRPTQKDQYARPRLPACQKPYPHCFRRRIPCRSNWRRKPTSRLPMRYT